MHRRKSELLLPFGEAPDDITVTHEVGERVIAVHSFCIGKSAEEPDKQRWIVTATVAREEAD